jgi:alpha-L-fucosidase
MSKEAFEDLHSSTDLQPAIITNDRLGKGHPGDYKTFERKIPEQAPQGMPWEVCMPISGSWGYKKSDTDFKSTTTLIRNLADIASKGGNYLLNVSPTGEGTLLPQAVERLEAIGQWMKVNGESIYDTTASPFGRFAWGRCTQKQLPEETLLYLHVFDWPEDRTLQVTGLKNRVEQSYLLANRKSLETRQQDKSVVVSLPVSPPDPINSVVVLKVYGALDIELQSPMSVDDGSLVLTADAAYIHNNEGSRHARVQQRGDTANNIGYWTDANAWVEWSLQVDQPGQYEILAELAVEQESSRFRIELAGQQKSVQVLSTGSYYRYATRPLATIRIDETGKYTLSIKPDRDAWQPINLRQLELKRRQHGGGK